LQATLKVKVSLVLANVPWDLLVPFVLTSPIEIHVYNKLVEDYEGIDPNFSPFFSFQIFACPLFHYFLL
jgi:hypothetical protein